MARTKRAFLYLKKEIEMKSVFWLPVLFSLGIVVLAGLVLFVAVIVSYGPSMFRWFESKGQTFGGSRSYVMSHGHNP